RTAKRVLPKLHLFPIQKSIGMCRRSRRAPPKSAVKTPPSADKRRKIGKKNISNRQQT
ncbi:hypothetical protein NPIL_664441, partial [Nephila pilipes]